jgi:hypothetical protein
MGQSQAISLIRAEALISKIVTRIDRMIYSVYFCNPYNVDITILCI